MDKLMANIANTTWAKFRCAYPLLRADRPKVILNNRLKTTLGRAWLTLNYVDLSSELVCEHGETILSWGIPHEFGHFVAWELFNDDGHGPAFKRVMLSIGGSPATFHPFVNNAHEARKYARMIEI